MPRTRVRYHKPGYDPTLNSNPPRAVGAVPLILVVPMLLACGILAFSVSMFINNQSAGQSIAALTTEPEATQEAENTPESTIEPEQAIEATQEAENTPESTIEPEQAIEATQEAENTPESTIEPSPTITNTLSYEVITPYHTQDIMSYPPTYTPYPTYTRQPRPQPQTIIKQAEPVVIVNTSPPKIITEIVIVEVTATETASPTMTSTATETASPTMTSTATETASPTMTSTATETVTP